MIDNCGDSFNAISGITKFTPAIPKFYWDVDSQEQGIRQLCKVTQKVIDFTNEMADQLNLNTETVNELKALFEKFVESGFKDYYYQLLAEWFDKNAFEIYNLVAKQVFFGLTDDGYFCAYVPDSLADIEFDTGAVYDSYTYGRLILRYNVDGSGVIDNTNYGEGTDIEVVKELQAKVEQMQKTLYTALSALG